MIFMGYTFTGGPHTFDSTPVNDAYYNSISVGAGQVDTLLGSKQTMTADEILNSEWNFDTILRALFQDDALAGNIDYAVSEIDKIRLKRRKQGELEWITLTEKEISGPEDLSFTYDDKTAAIGVYEYAVVPVMGGIEGSFFANSVESKFNGMFILDATGAYGTELEVRCAVQANQPTSVVSTLSRRFPFVIHNPSVRYDSGSASGYFVAKQDDGYDTAGGHLYRKKLNEFLLNGLPKILKFDDGRLWLVDITSPQISMEEQGHNEFVTTSFEWTETGDGESYDDLYQAGLIDGGEH